MTDSDLKPKSVLFVEHDENWRRNFYNFVSPCHSVILAANSSEALSILRTTEDIGVVVIGHDEHQDHDFECMEETYKEFPWITRILGSSPTNKPAKMAIETAHIYRFLPRPWQPNDIHITLKLAFREHEKQIKFQNIDRTHYIKFENDCEIWLKNTIEANAEKKELHTGLCELSDTFAKKVIEAENWPDISGHLVCELDRRASEILNRTLEHASFSHLNSHNNQSQSERDFGTLH